MKVNIKLHGADALAAALNSAAGLDFVKKAIKVHTARLDQSMKRKAVFTRGYSRGDTRRSIRPEVDSDGLTGRVKATTNYSGYLEKGTRKMAAQPFAEPALNEVEPGFLEDLNKGSRLKK